jgi:hypothetical protein
MTTVTVTDEAGKQRNNHSDALGRLKQVDEPSPAVAATGSQATLAITGSLQSTTTYSGGTAGQGSATVSGTVNRIYDDQNCLCYVYDSGTISLTVNGVTASATYFQGRTPAQIATILASGVASVVNTSVSGSTISMTAKTTGASTNYTVSMSKVSNDPGNFPSASFTLSWGNLTGGTNGTPTTVYDSRYRDRHREWPRHRHQLRLVDLHRDADGYRDRLRHQCRQRRFGQCRIQRRKHHADLANDRSQHQLRLECRLGHVAVR